MDKRDNQHCTLFKLVRSKTENSVDTSKGVFYCNDSDDLDECVFMTSRMFKEIWGKTWSSMPQEERLLPVVKITYGKLSIYRRYRQSSAKNLCMHQLGLTQRSIGLLCSDESLINQDVIEVSVGNETDFFENHPDHATRMSYKMGKYANRIGKESYKISKVSRDLSIASIVLAVVSIIISFVLAANNPATQ